jgi:hypothetical protein
MLYKLYHGTSPEDSVSHQLPEPSQAEFNSQDTTLADSPSVPTTSIPPSRSDTPHESPTPAGQRKRERGRAEASMRNNKRARGEEVIEALKALAMARVEAAEIAARGPMDKVSEALNVLLDDFTKEPRKLASDDMQTAIEFLSSPDKAAIFLSLSKKHVEHRDRWLGKQAKITISQERIHT